MSLQQLENVDMKLYRPIGLTELHLIAQSGWRAFPPRLEWQPIFYPVLNPTYAIQIAERWNTPDEFSGYCGFVTEFDVDDAFVARYPVQTVGDADLHHELWVPAAELDEFNAHIVGQIRVIQSFYGEKFAGMIDPVSQLPEW